jgi:hypothetical protein
MVNNCAIIYCPGSEDPAIFLSEKAEESRGFPERKEADGTGENKSLVL